MDAQDKAIIKDAYCHMVNNELILDELSVNNELEWLCPRYGEKSNSKAQTERNRRLTSTQWNSLFSSYS